jgi:hypothetical protein
MNYQVLYLPNCSYSAITGQCSQQSGTESQGIHSTEKYIAITAASGSGSTPPECNKVSIWHINTTWFRYKIEPTRYLMI